MEGRTTMKRALFNTVACTITALFVATATNALASGDSI